MRASRLLLNLGVPAQEEVGRDGRKFPSLALWSSRSIVQCVEKVCFLFYMFMRFWDRSIRHWQSLETVCANFLYVI